MKTGFGRLGLANGKEQIPHQGIDQGNNIGLTLWTLISTKLIIMILAKGRGIQFLYATSLSVISLVCFGFVNDTDLPVTWKHHSTEKDTLISGSAGLMDRQPYCHVWRTSSSEIMVLSHRLCLDRNKMEVQIN